MVQALRLLGVMLLLMASVSSAQAFQWPGHSQQQSPPQSQTGAIAAADLPPEARDTLHAIRQGGPYVYPRDGVVFGNFERLLPTQARGYYHEYTVKTPGVRSRGARRIIAGRPGEYYYSADHYQTFKRIQE